MTTLIFQLNKKMLLCIAIGIFCAVMLGFSMNWMEQFQKEAAYREYQYNTGSYIAYFSGELSRQDIDTIASDAHVSQCGIVTYYKKYLKETERIFGLEEQTKIICSAIRQFWRVRFQKRNMS